MHSKRVTGHRLLFVIALIGILSTHVISAQDEEEATTVATAEEVSEPTTAAGDQSTAEDSTTATGVDATTLVAQNNQDASTGVTGISAAASVTVAETVAETASGTSVAVGGDGADTTTGGAQSDVGTTVSSEELRTTGTGSVQVQAGSDAAATLSVGSSRGGTEGETTVFTGTPSTGGTEGTTGTTATEESTASTEKTKERTTVEYTSVEHTGTKGQTVTTKEAEQATTVVSTFAAPGYMTWAMIRIKWLLSVFTCNGLVYKVKGKAKYTYNATVHIVDESNPNNRRTCSWTYEAEIKYELVSSAVATHLKGKLTSGTRFRRDAGEIIVDVPRNLTIEEVENAFYETFKDLITGTKTPSSQDTGKAPAPYKSTSGTIWEAHYGLFLTVVILISVCVVVTAVCGLCMVWRRRGQDKHSDKQPIAMEEAREAPVSVSNPIPDDEMIQDEAPMQERENPAVTPNGGGQHISKADEDNGWVVPLDELSKAEKEKPEVENTRL